MRVGFTFLPLCKSVIIPINYNYFLTGLIYKIINNSSEDYAGFLHDKGYRHWNSKKGFKLFTYSMLMGRCKVRGDRISYTGSRIQWHISSPLDEFIQHLITGVFAEGREVKIGPEEQSNKFVIERVETLPSPKFTEKMSFTCLSPITVSKATVSPFQSSMEDNSVKPFKRETWNCHYLRPWEEGFSEAIKNNLIKKYSLIHGRDIRDADLEIKIDAGYMNRKNGKITKNINFKGTNIIGFMAPFEVTGSPELIEIGYEAGFGEKGSMGFGMVRITDRSTVP